MYNLVFYCCKQPLLNVKSFFVNSNNFDNLKVEYSRCPNCKKAFYREVRKDFKGKITSTSIKIGNEAEFLIKKAYLNRLDFFTNKGTKSNQNWYYGDYKKSNIKDEKNNLVEIQIKRNFNGEEVASFGFAKINYI